MDPSMYLDEEVWVEILKKLPVDELSRFRCVSKSWNSLISSPAFIRAQYLYSSNSVEPKPYFLFDDHYRTLSYAFYDPQTTNPLKRFQTLPFDACDPCGKSVLAHRRIIGDVIHGVACLSFDHDDDPYTILWNPKIRKFAKLPCPDSIDDVGFGFDGRNNDFKVVRGLRPERGVEKPTTLEVYSYQERRSKAVNTARIGPFSLVSDYCSCFKNGSIYFLIRRQNSSTIAVLVFDCETEELKTLELPERFNQHDLSVMPVRIFVYFGKVSVLEITKTTDDKGEVAVWAMDGYRWKKTARSSEDFVRITCRLEFISLSVDFDRYDYFSWGIFDEKVKRPQQLWNGHVFEPSMLLMDTERVTVKSSPLVFCY